MTSPDNLTMSRRRFITAAGLGAASAAGIASPWAASAAQPGTPRLQLADAVFDAFTTHRLVAVDDIHLLQESHDAHAMLLADPRLPDVVDDIVVEFGNALYQPVMDRFTAGAAVDNSDLRPVWRNATQSPMMTWDAPVYEHFYRTVRAVNWPLPPHKRIRVLLGDPPIDWSKITSPADADPFLASRDQHIAAVIETQVLAKGRRALITAGGAHLMHAVPGLPVSPTAVSLVDQHTGQRVWVIGTITNPPSDIAQRLSSYPRLTVLPTAGTWLGSVNAAEILPPGKPVTKPGFTDPFCGVPIGSLIDAMHYVGQATDLTVSRENPATYLDPVYWAELQRRNALAGNQVNLDDYRKEQPVSFLLSFPWPPPSC